MEKNNTERSEIMPLFEGLEDKEHVLTLTVSDEPANVWVKGHMTQIFAILSASNDMNCKHKDLSGSKGNWSSYIGTLAHYLFNALYASQVYN